MTLEFRVEDIFEIEIEIFNSKSRLDSWISDEIELQTELKIKTAIKENYKKLSIHL